MLQPIVYIKAVGRLKFWTQVNNLHGQRESSTSCSVPLSRKSLDYNGLFIIFYDVGMYNIRVCRQHMLKGP